MRKQTVNKNACLVLNLHILYQTVNKHACGKLASRKHTQKKKQSSAPLHVEKKRKMAGAGGWNSWDTPLGILKFQTTNCESQKLKDLPSLSGSFMPTIVRCPSGKQDIIHTLSKDASQWKHI